MREEEKREEKKIRAETVYLPPQSVSHPCPRPHREYHQQNPKLTTYPLGLHGN